METIILIIFLAAAILMVARHIKGVPRKPECGCEDSRGSSACSACPEAQGKKPRSN